MSINQKRFTPNRRLHFCHGPMYGHGTTGSGNRRYRCPRCGKTETERQPRVLGTMRTDLNEIVKAIRLLTEGNSILSTSRLTGLHPTTILTLLELAGEKAKAVHDQYIRQLHVRSVQADEMWTFVHTKEKRLKPGDPRWYGDQYIFVALAAESRLVLSHVVNKRTSASAYRLFEDLKGRVEGRTQITTDAWQNYPPVIENVFGGDVDYATTGNRLLWGDVHGRPDPTLIGTAYVERFNLTLRMSLRRLTRKCNGFSKTLPMLQAAVSLFVTYYNFCRVHATLKVTPAMEAGATGHVWTLEELIGRK